MLKFITAIPVASGLVAVVCTALFILSVSTDSTGSAIVAGAATAIFGLVSVIGFIIQRRVNAVADTFVKVVGDNAQKVTEAIVERVKKT